MWFSFKIFYWISSASASNCKKHWTLALDTGIGYWSSNDWNSKIYFASALCDRQKISDHDFSGIKKYEQNCTTASQIVTNCTVEKSCYIGISNWEMRTLCKIYVWDIWGDRLRGWRRLPRRFLPRSPKFSHQRITFWNPDWLDCSMRRESERGSSAWNLNHGTTFRSTFKKTVEPESKRVKRIGSTHTGWQLPDANQLTLQH